MTAFFALLLGIAAGLRSMTPIAAVTWAAHLGLLRLDGTAFDFLASSWAVGFFTVGAVLELVADKLPRTPSRRAPAPFGARILLGGLAGSALAAGNGGHPVVGAVAGAVGGVAGTLGGYEARMRSTKATGAPVAVALVEDAIAVGSSVLVAMRALLLR